MPPTSFLSGIARSSWYAFWRGLEGRCYRGREYTIQVPTGRRVLTPWHAADPSTPFGQVLASARAGGTVIMSPDRAFSLFQQVRRASRLPGDMAECGVYRGSSAALIAATLALRPACTATLHLFDTFAGVPDIGGPASVNPEAGHYAGTSVAAVTERLGVHAERCRFHPGFVPDTFARIAEVPAFSFVNLDIGQGPANEAACAWFWPRLVPGGALMINDYGMYPYRDSTRRVVDAFFEDLGEDPILLPTGQAIIIKTPVLAPA